MKNLELIQRIGNTICEGCGPHRDCGIQYEDCDRIQDALNVLEKHNVEVKDA